MDDIFDTLVQAIEENAFPLFYAQSEYRQSQHYAQKHMQWLEENLSKEAKEHLEKARDAEMEAGALKQEAMVRLALAAGIHLALAC